MKIRDVTKFCEALKNLNVRECIITEISTRSMIVRIDDARDGTPITMELKALSTGGYYAGAKMFGHHGFVEGEKSADHSGAIRVALRRLLHKQAEVLKSEASTLGSISTKLGLDPDKATRIGFNFPYFEDAGE